MHRVLNTQTEMSLAAA